VETMLICWQKWTSYQSRSVCRRDHGCRTPHSGLQVRSTWRQGPYCESFTIALLPFAQLTRLHVWHTGMQLLAPRAVQLAPNITYLPLARLSTCARLQVTFPKVLSASCPTLWMCPTSATYAHTTTTPAPCCLSAVFSVLGGYVSVSPSFTLLLLKPSAVVTGAQPQVTCVCAPCPTLWTCHTSRLLDT
jgi:hypothetical protein